MSTIEITLPVSRAVAERYGDGRERARLGSLVGFALTLGAEESEIAETLRVATAPLEERGRRLAEAFARTRTAARQAGLTAGQVEDELTAWKLEPAPPRP